MSILKKLKKGVKKVGKGIKKVGAATISAGTLGIVKAKDAEKALTKVGQFQEAIANTIVPQRALGNVLDKGMGALTLGQITGSDTAKARQRRADAKADAEPLNDNPAGVDEADLAPGELPGYDDAAVREARRKALARAAMRGGRRSTIIKDTSY